MRSSNHEYEVNDSVTWEEDGQVYIGVVSVVLSTQLLVHTRQGKDRFVMLNDRTLRRYVRGEG